MQDHENLLGINIGNTRTHLGSFVSGKLVEIVDVDNDADDAALDAAVRHALDPLTAADPCFVLLGSVNPPIEERVVPVVKRHTAHPVQRVERDLNVPVGRRLDRETIVGEDRLLNACAAFDVLRQACVIIDAGTAVTVDFVDGEGTFHGGAIGPGAQLMLDSLASRTAQLPEVEFDAPIEVIGHNTVEAMRTAVFYGVRGMVRELVEQYAEAVGVYPMVIATGGDAPKLFTGYELVERIVPDLTLLGLMVTLRSALKHSDDGADGSS